MLPFAMSPTVKLILSSLAGGIGVAVVFSVAVLGIARSGESRRERTTGPAAAYGTLGAAGLVLAAALVVLGVVLVAHKS
jgi:hypothetical protein